MNMKKTIVDKLKDLRNQFYDEIEKRPENFSEEYIRSAYLNKVLEIFGWNIYDTSEIIQEKVIKNKETRRNLNSISSKHTKPDYQLLDRGVLKLYFDAKNARINFLENESISFQIRSYGWSSGLRFSIVSDFEYFRVYDTRTKPDVNMAADYQTITFSIDDLINMPDLYFQFLSKEKIQNNNWNLKPFSVEIKEGYLKSIDHDFIELIKELQINLANGMIKSNSSMTPSDLQYYAQIIINRLLFHRILESINYEPEGKLLEWITNGKGFWNQFNDSCMREYYEKYDGAMYEFCIPSTVQIADIYFEEFINSLYGYTPYRFDAIEPEFIAEMYDYFLGKELSINNNKINIENKEFLPNGSVPTPPELAGYVVENVLNCREFKTEKDLLELKILDPCAGSGTFLITSLDILIKKLKEIKGVEILSYESIKNIVKSCLYGVDIDPIAIEVLKMTISLKLVLTKHLKPEPLDKILNEISYNFRLGNSIVGSDINKKHKLSARTLMMQIPTDYADIFPEIMEDGGFTHIFTNPPYIEPKYYKSEWPVIYEYLRDRYLIKKGKTDVSMFFLERAFELLRYDGELGIVIQKRFFTTDYGKKMRDWLAKNKFIVGIKEYMSNSIFRYKTTYIAIIHCKKSKNKSLSYNASISEVDNDRSNLIEIINNVDFSRMITQEELSESPNWSYRYFKNASIISKLINDEGFYTINNSNKLKVTVGPQALDKQYYFIRNAKQNNGVIKGEISYKDPDTNNKTVKIIKIEKDLAKRIYENNNLNSFENFRKDVDSTYLIFPYDNNAKLLDVNVLKSNYPLAYKYLKWMDSKSTNERRKEPNEFYGYTRNQNLKYISYAKIFIPMTSKRVIASLSEGNVYGDNSNINAIIDVVNDDINLLKALTVILNSEMFSLLAICLSGEARGSYYKMNKQFIGEVPIPKLNKDETSYLSNVYDNIIKTIDLYDIAYGNQKNYVYQALKKLQSEQNRFIENKYNLKKCEIDVLKDGINLKSLNWLEEMR